MTVARSITVHSLLWSLDRIFRQDIPWRWRVIVDLGGLHVGVTMAILLNLPRDLPMMINGPEYPFVSSQLVT